MQPQSIFICYRRADSSDVTSRIYDRLVAKFGRTQVFKDVDSIPIGVDFRTHIDDKVARCAVFIAVIGRNWLRPTQDGENSLNDPSDFVRLEIEAALRREIALIPVLVHDAKIPAEAAVPDSMRNLIYRQGIPVRPDPDFHRDMDRLIDRLNVYFAEATEAAAASARERQAREAEQVRQADTVAQYPRRSKRRPSEIPTDQRRFPSRLTWGVAAVALVALIVTIAAQRFVRRSGEPSQAATTAQPTAPGSAAAPIGGTMDTGRTRPIDITPTEAASRLYNRAMAAHELGLVDTMKMIAPMAIAAYQKIGKLDTDQHYDVGRLAAVSGNEPLARAEADTILAQNPNHLLGLILAGTAANMRREATAERIYHDKLLAASAAERAKQLPEYAEHENDILAALRARVAVLPTSEPTKKGSDQPSTSQTYFDYQVEKQVSLYQSNVPPAYPPELRAANVTGEVLAQFVVDTAGKADMSTLKILRSTHDYFSRSVISALPNLRFSPAEIHRTHVRELVQMPFQFSLTP